MGCGEIWEGWGIFPVWHSPAEGLRGHGGTGLSAPVLQNLLCAKGTKSSANERRSFQAADSTIRADSRQSTLFGMGNCWPPAGSTTENVVPRRCPSVVDRTRIDPPESGLLISPDCGWRLGGWRLVKAAAGNRRRAAPIAIPSSLRRCLWGFPRDRAALEIRRWT